MGDFLEILKLLSAAASGILPLPWLAIANLAEVGVAEVFAEIDRQREIRGLSWQELEAQLRAQNSEEAERWAAFVARLEKDGQ